MEGHAPARIGRILVVLALFFTLGTPLVAYIWHTLNVLLTGRVELLALAILVPVLLLFWLLLKGLARAVDRLDARHAAETGRAESPPA